MQLETGAQRLESTLEGSTVAISQILQAIAGAIYLLTITAVGIRLLILARRNRGVPEFIIGLSLLVGGTFGSVLEAVGLSGQLGNVSATTGRTVTLPLPTDHPVYQRGINGMAEIDVWERSRTRNAGLFGLREPHE